MHSITMGEYHIWKKTKNYIKTSIPKHGLQLPANGLGSRLM